MLRNEVEFGQEIKYLHNLYHLRGRQKSNFFFQKQFGRCRLSVTVKTIKYLRLYRLKKYFSIMFFSCNLSESNF